MTAAEIASATSQTVELASGPTHVLTDGSGPDLLLLHHDVGPFGWGPFQEELAKHFRVVAPDLPGFGESPRCEWARHPRDFAFQMLSLTRHMGLRRYTLVGLGFGGWVAAEMAAFAYPGMHNLVLASPAGIRPDTGFILDQVMEEQLAYVRAGFESSETFDALFPDPRDKELRARLDAARETIARVSWKPYMYSYELPEMLREVDLPVTVVWGDNDRVIPSSTAAQFAAVLPKCRMERMATASHYLDIERPAELAAIIIASSKD